MSFLDEEFKLKVDKDVILGPIKYHTATMITFDPPPAGSSIPEGFIVGARYPCISYAFGTIAAECCIAILSDEFVLNYYRLLDYLSVRHLNIE